MDEVRLRRSIAGAYFMQAIYLITTGGTIDKTYSECTGKLLNLAPKIGPYLAQMRLPHTRIKIVPLIAKDSVELTAEDRGKLCSAVRRRLASLCPIVITHGTDTMVETALDLARCLGQVPVPIIFTGALRRSALKTRTECKISRKHFLRQSF